MHMLDRKGHDRSPDRDFVSQTCLPPTSWHGTISRSALNGELLCRNLRLPAHPVWLKIDLMPRSRIGPANHLGGNRVAHRLLQQSWLFLWGCLLLSNAVLIGQVRAQAVIDEARQAGRSAQSFPAADEDYFQAMDGGIALTPDEVKGRNMWIVWTGGDDRLWDELTTLTFGSFDLLKTVSTHPTLKFSRDNRWNYLGLVNEPCFTKPTAPNPTALDCGSMCAIRLPGRSVRERREVPGRRSRGARQEPAGRLLLRLCDRHRRSAAVPESGFDDAAAKQVERRRGTTPIPNYYLQRNWCALTGSECPAASVTSGPIRPSRPRTRRRRSGRISVPPSARSIFGSTAFSRGTAIRRPSFTSSSTPRGPARSIRRWCRPTTSTIRAR